MRDFDYRVVDVFADAPLQGNPLAVFVDAAGLDGGTMQQLANETNLSETTFVTGGGDHGFDVRIYTPSLELPFAGHPTLGTAAVLRRGHDLTLNLAVGAVPVAYESERDLYWLSAPPVTLDAALDTDALLSITGLSPADLDEHMGPQRVSAGPSFVFLPLASLDALERCHMNLDRYRQHFPDDTMPNVYAFARGGGAGFDLTCRLFFLAGGVREDPATGSAAACLGRYLVDKHYFAAGDVDICVSQGAWMGRPSRLYIRSRDDARAPDVRVGGQVQDVASGRFTLPS